MSARLCFGKPIEHFKLEGPCSGLASADIEHELRCIDERLTRLENHIIQQCDERKPCINIIRQSVNKPQTTVNRISLRQGSTLEAPLKELMNETGSAELFASQTTKTNYTAADWLSDHSLPAAIVFMMGGLHVFANKRLQQVYICFWALSFWICGCFCVANLYYQELPFYNFSTDCLTAYVHVPVFLSWIFWRRFLSSSHGLDMLKVLQKLSSRSRSLLLTIMRVGAWSVLVMMITMTSVVLAGFSLPSHTERYGRSGKELVNSFLGVHALVMWPVIPPVIMSLIASYSMAVFFAFLHIMDVRHTTKHCLDVLQTAHSINAEAFVLDGQTLDDREASILLDLEQTDTRMKDVLEILVGEVFQKSRNETDFEFLAVTIEALVTDVQKRIDFTCQSMQGVMLHLLMFSWAQILVVMTNLQFHFGSESSTSYTYYWICQDLFHFAAGVVLVAMNLALGAVVTGFAVSLKCQIVSKLTEYGMSRMKLAAITSMLNQRVVGYHFFHVPVNLSEVFPFVFSTVLLLFTTFCAIADHQFTYVSA